MPAPLRQRLVDHRNPLLVGAAIVLLVAAVVVVALLKSRGGTPQAGRTPAPTSAGSSPSALPTPTPTVPSYGESGAPTSSERALLAERVGFGGKVTGGAGGQIVHVTTDADSGAGSLRAAVAGDSPRWVVFDKDMTIKLTTPLPVGSNKTIDGTGRKVEITGPGIQGLDIIGVSNVIVESLTLHDFGDVTQTINNNLPDAIHIERANGVWIDHCDLSMAGDKLIGVTTGSSGLTVSWSHFHDQEQTFQVGNQSTAAQDVRQTVTVHDNFFDRTGYRNPVIDYGLAHVYNNYYLDWKTYGVRSERHAQMYLQNNVFKAGRNIRAAIVVPHAGGCNDAKTHCDDSTGNLKASGNLLLDGAKIKDHSVQSAVVFDPAKYYKYTVAPATPALAALIVKDAGPRP